MRSFLIWSWSLNLLLLLGIFVTETNIMTNIGITAVMWCVGNTIIQWAAEPFYGRRQ